MCMKFRIHSFAIVDDAEFYSIFRIHYFLATEMVSRVIPVTTKKPASNAGFFVPQPSTYAPTSRNSVGVMPVTFLNTWVK